MDKEQLKLGKLVLLISEAGESCWVLLPPSQGRAEAYRGRQSNACPAQAKGEGNWQPL